MTSYTVRLYEQGQEKKSYKAPAWNNIPSDRVIRMIKDAGFIDADADANVSIRVFVEYTGPHRGAVAGRPTYYAIPGAGVNTTLNTLSDLGVSL